MEKGRAWCRPREFHDSFFFASFFLPLRLLVWVSPFRVPAGTTTTGVEGWDGSCHLLGSCDFPFRRAAPTATSLFLLLLLSHYWGACTPHNIRYHNRSPPPPRGERKGRRLHHTKRTQKNASANGLPGPLSIADLITRSPKRRRTGGSRPSLLFLFFSFAFFAAVLYGPSSRYHSLVPLSPCPATFLS